jgi:hypothetical protein
MSTQDLIPFPSGWSLSGKYGTTIRRTATETGGTVTRLVAACDQPEDARAIMAAVSALDHLARLLGYVDGAGRVQVGTITRQLWQSAHRLVMQFDAHPFGPPGAPGLVVEPATTALELGNRIHELTERALNELEGGAERAAAAIRTLEAKGYTWRGGEHWAPPLGEPRRFEITTPSGPYVDRLRGWITPDQAVEPHAGPLMDEPEDDPGAADQAAVDRFVAGVHTVDAAGFDDLPAGIPEHWAAKPFCRIRWYQDTGDESVGMQGRWGWELADDQAGTVVADLVAGAKAAEQGRERVNDLWQLARAEVAADTFGMAPEDVNTNCEQFRQVFARLLLEGAAGHAN